MRPPRVFPTPSSFVMLATLLTLACSRAPGADPSARAAEARVPLAVAGVRVTDLTSPDERPEGYALPDVTAWAADELARATSLRLTREPGAGAPSISLALLYGVVTSDRESTRTALAGSVLTAGVQANLAVAVPGEPPLTFQAERIAEQPLTEADAQGFGEALSRQLEGLTRATLRQLDRKVALQHAAEADVIATLSADDDALIEYAATLVGERGLTAGVPRLLALLKSQNPALRLRAIGALGQLRAAEAAGPLAALAGGAESPREIAAAVQALADLDNDEARRYLASVRSTTPFDDVRKLVDQVLGGGAAKRP